MNDYFIPKSWVSALMDTMGRSALECVGIDASDMSTEQVAAVLMAVTRLESGEGSHADAVLIAEQPRIRTWWQQLAERDQ